MIVQAIMGLVGYFVLCILVAVYVAIHMLYIIEKWESRGWAILWLVSTIITFGIAWLVIEFLATLPH